MPYNTYLFTYHFGGANWELPIKAKTFEEAELRLHQMAKAWYAGKLMVSIPVSLPVATWKRITRPWRALFREFG